MERKSEQTDESEPLLFHPLLKSNFEKLLTVCKIGSVPTFITLVVFLKADYNFRSDADFFTKCYPSTTGF